MKRIARIILTFVMALSLGTAAHAQIPTTDGAVLGGQVAQTIQEWMSHLESMQNALQQLKQAESLTSTINSTYRVISSTVKDAAILRDVYQTYQLVVTDVQQVSRFIDYIDSNHLPLSRISAMYSIADNVLADAVDMVDYISNTLLSPDESLSLHERLLAIADLNDKMMKDHHLISNMIADIITESRLLDAISQSEEYEQSAFGSIKEPAATITPGLDFSQIEALIESRAVGSTVPTGSGSYSSDIKGATAKFTDDKTVGHIFNLAILLIGIIAVGYSVWNFAMVNSGERQKQDSQFKVFAGMLIGVLLLQALKAMFF